MIVLITRYNSQRDVMHLSLEAELLANGHTKVSCRKRFGILYVREFFSPNNVVIVDDPISCILARLIKPTWVINFWSFEMADKQMAINSVWKLARALIFKLFYLISYSLAERIIFPSKLRRDAVIRQFSLLNISRKSKIVMNIPHIFDDRKNSDKLIVDKVTSFSQKYEHVAIYSGNMGGGRNLLDIVEHALILPSTGLILCGKIDEKVLDIHALPDDVMCLGNLSSPTLNEVYRLCDIGYLNYIDEIENTRLCAPVKIWEYVQHGLYVFSNSNYAMRHEWSHLVDYFYDSGGLDKKIFQNLPMASSIKLEKNRLSEVYFV